MFSTSFPNLTQPQLATLISSMFEHCRDQAAFNMITKAPPGLTPFSDNGAKSVAAHLIGTSLGGASQPYLMNADRHVMLAATAHQIHVTHLRPLAQVHAPLREAALGEHDHAVAVGEDVPAKEGRCARIRKVRPYKEGAPI